MAVEVFRPAAARGGRLARAAVLSGWEGTVFFTAFVVVAISHTRHLNTDTFLALSGGRDVALRGLPHADNITVAAGARSWVDQQWLGQLILYRVWQLGGYAAVALVSAALVASSVALLFRLLRLRGSAPRRALKWCTLALAGALVDVSARTQDFAYPLFVLLLVLLLGGSTAAVRPTRRWALAVLGILTLWANVHGSVLVGAGLTTAICCYRAAMCRDRRRAYLTVGALAPLTVLATPYGASIVRYYQAVLGNGAIREYSSEWQPALPTNIAAIGFLAVFVTVLAVVVMGWKNDARPSIELGLVALLLGIAALSAIRWGAWAAIVGVVVATDILNRMDGRHADRKPAPPIIVLAAATMAFAVGLGFFSLRTTTFIDQTPVRAMAAASRYAMAHPRTKVLADDVSASALLWLHPELRGRVGFDGRLEVYSQSDIRAWESYVLARPGGMELADRYQVLVASKMNRPLVLALRALPGARTIYDGSDGIVVVA